MCEQVTDTIHETEMVEQKNKDVTFHLPRKIVATMSTSPQLTSMLNKTDTWCVKGQNVKDIIQYNMTSTIVKTVWIHSLSMSDMYLTHSLTFRAPNIPKITSVEPIGPHSNYESAYVNSFSAETLDTNTQRWRPSQSGGVTATSFRVHFESDIDLKHVQLEVIGLVLNNFSEEVWKNVKSSGHFLITSEGLEMKGPE